MQSLRQLHTKINKGRHLKHCIYRLTDIHAAASCADIGLTEHVRNVMQCSLLLNMTVTESGLGLGLEPRP